MFYSMIKFAVWRMWNNGTVIIIKVLGDVFVLNAIIGINIEK